jgi:hypothetical protein
MDCRFDEKLIVSYFDNELEEEKKESVERHLKSCKMCEGKCNLFKSLRVLSDSINEIKAPYYLESKTLAFIDESIELEKSALIPSRFFPTVSKRGAFAIIFSIAALFLIAISFDNNMVISKFENLSIKKSLELGVEKNPPQPGSFTDLENIITLAFQHSGELSKFEAPKKDIATLFGNLPTDTKQVFDTITFYSDPVLDPRIESHFEW